jgi:hypothetical protein
MINAFWIGDGNATDVVTTAAVAVALLEVAKKREA